jgi:hypothetical protein
LLLILGISEFYAFSFSVLCIDGLASDGCIFYWRSSFGFCSVFIKVLEGGPTYAFCIPYQLSKKITKVTQLPHVYIKQSISPPSYTLRTPSLSLYFPPFSKSQQGTAAAFVPLSLSNKNKNKKPYVHVILLYVEKSRHIGKVKKREKEISKRPP